MQSAGTISVGTLNGATWTVKCKLEANCDGTFAGGMTAASGIISNSGHLTTSTRRVSGFGTVTHFNGKHRSLTG